MGCVEAIRPRQCFLLGIVEWNEECSVVVGFLLTVGVCLGPGGDETVISGRGGVGDLARHVGEKASVRCANDAILTDKPRAGVLDRTLVSAMGPLNTVDAQQGLWKAELTRQKCNDVR